MVALKDFEVLLTLGSTFSLTLVSVESVQSFVKTLCLKIFKIDAFIEEERKAVKAQLDSIDTDSLKGDEKKIDVIREHKISGEKMLDELKVKQGRLVELCLVEHLMPAFLWAFVSGLFLLFLSTLGNVWDGALIYGGLFSVLSLPIVIWHWIKSRQEMEISVSECASKWVAIVVAWGILLLVGSLLDLPQYAEKLGEVAWWVTGLYAVSMVGNFVRLYQMIQTKTEVLKSDVISTRETLEEHLGYVQRLCLELSKGNSIDKDKEIDFFAED